MANILANSQIDLNRVKGLLDKGGPPVYRKAYSDRTAWVMACLSELAYIKFNPSILDDKRKKFLQENILKSLNENTKTALLKWIDLLEYDHAEEREKLERELKTLGMGIIKMFDRNGTQAVLISYGESVVLVFRGTEATSMKDIKSDADAETMQCETGGKIHSGFKNAFDEVALDIQKKLDENTLNDKPLFITGHSLGGALATVAAKKLSHKGGIAACYTFGSPRVGDEEWIADIKTPVYRLVNAADCVTMLPPSGVFISILGWLGGAIPWVGSALKEFLLSKLEGYLHAGNMRYLTNCPSGKYDDVKLLYSVGFAFRVKGMWKKFTPKKPLKDHSISIYRKKLMVIAEKRNQNGNTN